MRAIVMLGLLLAACEGRPSSTKPAPAQTVVQHLEVGRDVLSADKSVLRVRVRVNYTTEEVVAQPRVDALVQETAMAVASNFKALDAYQNRDAFEEALRQQLPEALAPVGVKVLQARVLKVELDARLQAFVEARARRDQARAQAEAERQRAIAEAQRQQEQRQTKVFTALTRVDVRPEAADTFAHDAARHVASRAAAQGRIDAALLRDQKQPTSFVFIEDFRSLEAMEAYFEAPTHEAWRQATAEVTTSWVQHRHVRLVP